MEPAIRIENLTKIFYKNKVFKKEETRAVVDLSLEVQPGEVFGFLGPNGAGKSTTIKVLMRILFPTSGKAWILGREISDPEARRSVGFLPENPYFYDYLTAEEFLWLNGRLYGLGGDNLKTRINYLLDFVGLQDHAKTRLRKFSKGMLQRIGLAQALINDPELVILDEPTSGLDPLGRRMVLDLIRKLKEQGKTVFFSTHILPDVEAVSDSVAIIIQGKLRKTGKLSELLETSDRYRVRFMKVADERILKRIEHIANTTVQHSEDVYMAEVSARSLYNVIDLIRLGKGRVLTVEPHRRTLEELFLEEVEVMERTTEEQETVETQVETSVETEEPVEQQQKQEEDVQS